LLRYKCVPSQHEGGMNHLDRHESNCRYCRPQLFPSVAGARARHRREAVEALHQIDEGTACLPVLQTLVLCTHALLGVLDTDQYPYSSASADSAEMRERTGLDLEEFEFVYDIVRGELEGQSVRKRKKHSDSQEGQPFLGPRNKLMLCLEFLRTGHTLRHLGLDYEIPRQTAHDIIHHLIPVISQKLSHFVAYPSVLKSFRRSGALRNVACAVDTTIICTDKPQDQETLRAIYAKKGKRSKFGAKVQLVVGLDGRIWEVSDAYRAAESDSLIYDESELPEVLEEEHKLAIGDQAYSAKPRVLTPLRRGKDGLEAAAKEKNAAIHSARAVVENVNQRFKQSRLLYGVYRGDPQDYDFISSLAMLAAELVNIDIQKRPIRKRRILHDD
jgi:hypothetical protein